jgi:hypothetical protein
MDRLWQVLLRAVEDEGPLKCEDCLVLMDYLSDLLAGGYPSKEVLALADRYLQRCPDCQTTLQEALAELAIAHEDALQAREIGIHPPVVQSGP